MKLGNLSNLSVRLQEIEAGLVKRDGVGLGDARLGVVNALEQFRNSRYRLGQMLATYKRFFCAAHGWMAAAREIAGVMCCDERTLRRIVDDFERVSGVPDVVIKALERAGIDPATRKNATLISRILRMPCDAMNTTPEFVVSRAIGAVKAPSHSSSGKVHPAPAPLSLAEKRRLGVRKKILTALSAVPEDQKLVELIAAVEEVMFADWGQVEPITVTITPRRSPEHASEGVERRMAA
jgi:hypothetical protein